ncbi:MAG TPA: hypothetical protein VJ783_19640 [Pirellulales bacterium]|nr:hypothetical protein [Pirellulales bacterium]
MVKTASRKRSKPGIGPRGLFFLLAAGVVLFVLGRHIWPGVPGPVRYTIRITALYAFLAFLSMNLVVFFNVWRRR